MVGIFALPHAFHFEVQEEAFSDGIVPAITLATHAANEAVAGQLRLILGTGVLAGAVGRPCAVRRKPVWLACSAPWPSRPPCASTGQSRPPGTASRRRSAHR